MFRTSVFTAACLLAGCSSTGYLTPVSPNAPISGTVTRGIVEPYQIEVVLDGKVYRGEWRTEAAPEHPQANSYLHKRHVGKVTSTLWAEDGAQLACAWLVHGQAGSGSCITAEKREYGLQVR